MPIYEFKCTNCGEYTELLVINTEKKIELKCIKCDSKNLERIVSYTNYAMSTGNSGSEENSSSKKTRTCSNGSCTTYNIPGVI